ncbi:hypothetical protein OSB04_028879 [Centaurea solstitialis]|uniref:DUF4283 domain-containing protein n=1 Tax=Centaurea solstitialis TaxID=347529 RepID=A0AA38SP20_9ASTR|nr:hypothetical protein OSB04_028879 [Centaurea solstitialis]
MCPSPSDGSMLPPKTLVGGEVPSEGTMHAISHASAASRVSVFKRLLILIDLRFHMRLPWVLRMGQLPLELTKSAASNFRSTLYGYFLGPRILFPIVQRAATNTWGRYGFRDVMLNNNGFYFFRFNDEGGSKVAMEKGPLMVKKVPLFVPSWDPSNVLLEEHSLVDHRWTKSQAIQVL